MFSGLWVLLSDRVLEALVPDAHWLTLFQTYKGWAFVGLSAVLLFSLLRREFDTRDRVEKALRRSEENYRRLVEQASDGIFILGPQENFLDVNTAGYTLLGYSREEMLRMHLHDVIPEEGRVNQANLLEDVRAGKTILRERLFRRKDGRLLPVEISAKILNDGRIQSIVRDISDRKQAEENIQRQLRRLAALRVIDLAITATLDMHMTFGILMDQVVTHLEVDAASLLLVDPATQGLVFAAGRGFESTVVWHNKIPLGEGLAGRVALEQRMVCVPDLAHTGEVMERAEIFATEGFVCYYGVPLIVKGQVKGVLETFQRQYFEPNPEWLNFLEALAGQAAIAVENVTLYENLERSSAELFRAYDATLEGWSHALELRDRETQGHSHRVTELTLRVAKAVGIDGEHLVNVRRGTLLHDIGKMGVPDHILLKPGPLTPEEWDIMRRHPIYAFEMLAPIQFLRQALDIPYCHHERWDGTGYPRGLKGEQIPLEARIFAVVDVWDALRSDRPYRSAWPVQRVRRYLQDRAGAQFDPQIVKTFLEIMSEE